MSPHPRPAPARRGARWLCATFLHTHTHQLAWPLLSTNSGQSPAYAKLSTQNVYPKTALGPAPPTGELERAAGCSPRDQGSCSRLSLESRLHPPPDLLKPRKSGSVVLGWEEESQGSPQPCNGTPLRLGPPPRKSAGPRAELPGQASQGPSLPWAPPKHGPGRPRTRPLPVSPGFPGTAQDYADKHPRSSAPPPPPPSSAPQDGSRRRLRSEKALIGRLLDPQDSPRMSSGCR